MRLALPVLFVACSGTAHQISMGPPPARSTDGVLAGPLCNGAECKCRDLSAPEDGGVGVPSDATHKRFEVRLTSPQEIWAQIGTSQRLRTGDSGLGFHL